MKTLDDLFNQELIVSGAAWRLAQHRADRAQPRDQHQFRIIEGYTGIADSMIAIERGEAEGVCSSYGQFRSLEHHFRDGRLRVLLRAEEAPMAELPDVPSIYPFAKTDEQRHFLRFVLSTTEFGRPYVLPPETPKDRVEMLRSAIAAAVKDPELIAEANKMRLDMAFQSPAIWSSCRQALRDPARHHRRDQEAHSEFAVGVGLSHRVR